MNAVGGDGNMQRVTGFDRDAFLEPHDERAPVDEGVGVTLPAQLFHERKRKRKPTEWNTFYREVMGPYPDGDGPPPNQPAEGLLSK